MSDAFGNLDDLVAFHHVAADARDAAIGLVVDENVAAVIGAVGERHVRVMRVAVDEGAAPARPETCGLRQQPFGEDLPAFVGQSPAGGAVAIEHRDAHELAHRREADDAHLAGLAAAAEAVIFVEIARPDLDALAARLGRGRPREGREAPAPAARQRPLREQAAPRQPTGATRRRSTSRSGPVPARGFALSFLRH